MRPLRSAFQLMLAALLLPTLGHAAYSVEHVSISCSSSLTQVAGNALSYSCDGDLNLLGEGEIGLLTSDTAIILSASGSLTLDKLSLTAPSIEIGSASGNIFVGADTRFFSLPGDPVTPPTVTLITGPRVTMPPLRPIEISAGAIVTQPGNVHLHLQTTVPEPSSSSLALFGLLGVAWLRRKA